MLTMELRLMVRSRLFPGLLIALLIPQPVFGEEAPKQTIAAELPDVSLPPELDRVLREYERAWADGNAAALASLFTEDGFVLQSNAPPVRGRLAIQQIYEEQGGAPLRLRALAFSNGSTNAVIIGGYRYGEQSVDIGKFTLTLRRMPGDPWLIFSDMDNANALPRSQSVPPAFSPAEPPPGS